MPISYITNAGTQGVITQGTAQASTSGTSITFTGIPSWAKRVTVMFKGVTVSGSSNVLLQLGSGSITTSGYVGSCWYSTANITTSTSGMPLTSGGTNPSELYNGIITLVNLTGNTWVESGILIGNATQYPSISGNNVTLSGALDRINITTISGTPTFTAGSINILYE